MWFTSNHALFLTSCCVFLCSESFVAGLLSSSFLEMITFTLFFFIERQSNLIENNSHVLHCLINQSCKQASPWQNLCLLWIALCSRLPHRMYAREAAKLQLQWNYSRNSRCSFKQIPSIGRKDFGKRMTTALQQGLYKEHQGVDYLSRNFESHFLHTPQYHDRITVSQDQ